MREWLRGAVPFHRDKAIQCWAALADSPFPLYCITRDGDQWEFSLRTASAPTKPNTMEHRTLLSFTPEGTASVTIHPGNITVADTSDEQISLWLGHNALNNAIVDYIAKRCDRAFQEQLIQTLTDQIRPSQTDAN